MKILKWAGLGLFLFVAIFLLSNVSKAFIRLSPELLTVRVMSQTNLKAVVEQVPGAVLENEKESLVRVPYGKAESYTFMFAKIQGVARAARVPISPQFSMKHYFFSVQDQLKAFASGDLGQAMTGANNNFTRQVSFSGVLKQMVINSISVLIPSLAAAVILGLLFAVIASIYRSMGKVLDAIHFFLVGIPDFIVVIVVILLAIFFSRFTTERLILIVQLNPKEVPFLIPFLTITLVPSVMMYGTLRNAIAREMSEGYIVTAMAKGLSRSRVIVRHVLRNVMADLFAVLPPATKSAIASLVVAEAMCNITGLGGFIVHPLNTSISTVPLICVTLAILTLLLHGLYFVLGKMLLVNTKETDRAQVKERTKQLPTAAVRKDANA